MLNGNESTRDDNPTVNRRLDTGASPVPSQITSTQADANTSPNIPSEQDHLNTDKRKIGDWESRYNLEARKAIRVDAVYVSFIFILTLVLLVSTWTGRLHQIVTGGSAVYPVAVFNQYCYFFLGGLLGGTIFGIKYLYKVVGRGYWNLDRRLWRLFSPFISGGLALVIGALIESGVLGLTTKNATPSAYFSLGFIAGYFADSALAKMQEIAETVFGSTSPDKH